MDFEKAMAEADKAMVDSILVPPALIGTGYTLTPFQKWCEDNRLIIGPT